VINSYTNLVFNPAQKIHFQYVGKVLAHYEKLFLIPDVLEQSLKVLASL